MPDVQVAKRKCWVELPFVIKDALLAVTKEQAQGWHKSDHQIAQTIADAIPTKDIKIASGKLRQMGDEATVDLKTTISLTFPGSMRAQIPIVVTVGLYHVEVHPNYEKPAIKRTISGHA
jgi:hypothetical protein